MSRGAKNPASQVIAITLISAMFSVVLSAFPGGAAADISSVQTFQLLPVGNNECTPLSAYNFTPYVYDGALHSFSFIVSDSSYVALAGSAGSTPIPFHYMTRHEDTVGALRVHVDIPTTRVSGELPLSVTLVSAQGSGRPVCMSIVNMTVLGPVAPTANVPVSTTLPTSPPAVTEPMPAPSEGSADTAAEESAEETAGETSVLPEDEDDDIVTKPTFLSIGNLQNRVVDLCMAGGASRLWIVLLTIYAVIAVVAVLFKPANPSTYTREQRVATVVTPLVLLLGFWYFAESCRTAPWMPIAAIVIATAGLAGVYWNHPKARPYTAYLKTFFKVEGAKRTEVMQATLPTTRQTTIITPPPSSSPPPAEKSSPKI